MTIAEFKAWLEGFEASFKYEGRDSYPTPAQWAVIKEKLATVSAVNVSPGMSWTVPYPLPPTTRFQTTNKGIYD